MSENTTGAVKGATKGSVANTASGTTRRPRKKLFQGYPRGWFCVGFTTEYAPGDMKKMTYFGQKLIAFRGEDGVMRVLDAFCAHLGANLGNGEVIGNTVQCPFHSWRYNGQGICVDIPYAKKIPKKALVRAWIVREKNGMIYLWHDPKHREPDWEMPDMNEVDDDNWMPWNHSIVHIKTHPREIVENVVDKGHFAPVHNTHVDFFENEFDRHIAIQRTGGVAYPQGGGKDKFKITATYYGPAIQFSVMEGYLESRLVNAHTPVDEQSLDLRFAVTLRIKPELRERMAEFSEKYAENLRLGFHEDIDIWEDKCFREVPVLCDGDGPIIKLRAWYGQFYAGNIESTE